MHQAALDALNGWANFYVIVGSSAGALTGLQFVVIALVAQLRVAGNMHDVRAFGSPTVVNFGAVLFISATLTAPWRSLASAGLPLALCGAAGVVYSLNSIWHARQPSAYTPDSEDWVWFVVLPLALHLALLVSAILLTRHPYSDLFGIAGIALLLLFVGIRNAWDTVTYVAVQKNHERDKDKAE